MATNNFTVFGTQADSSTIYNTGSEGRTALFTAGLKKNTSARAEDVLTPLREVSLVTVSVLDWIKEVSSSDFETPKNEEEISEFIDQVKNSLTAKINSLISNKQDKIGTGTGFLKMSGSSWTWDNSSYQTINSKLTQLININTAGLVSYSTDGSYKITSNKYMYLDESKSDPDNGLIYLIY